MLTVNEFLKDKRRKSNSRRAPPPRGPVDDDLPPLVTLDDFMSHLTTLGVATVEDGAHKALNAQLKVNLRELVSRSKLSATCLGRAQPTEADAIIAVRNSGVYGPAVIRE